MRKRLFKYKWLNAIVIVFNFCLLLIFSFATFDTYNLFKSEAYAVSNGKYFALLILAFGSLFSFVSLILVLLKLSKSLFFLNLFYGILIVIFLVGLATMFLQEFAMTEEDIPLFEYVMLSVFICITTLLVILVNKYRYKEVKCDNIEFIGQKEE
ncbi:hypothetical protein [Chryseobacterium paludis]|uniref:hypothetical protein n=1 Tax=Chryseobacterium paludis TaxID=2956784 RepID=UPI0021BF5BD4|nr:hypothetical protein [Chryseobacterium paludis]